MNLYLITVTEVEKSDEVDVYKHIYVSLDFQGP